MNLLQALKDVVRFLQEQEIDYALIGGFAIQFWGEPRTTHDIDITVMVPFEKQENFLQKNGHRTSY